jgi:hypothetical protein
MVEMGPLSRLAPGKIISVRVLEVSKRGGRLVVEYGNDKLKVFIRKDRRAIPPLCSGDYIWVSVQSGNLRYEKVERRRPQDRSLSS